MHTQLFHLLLADHAGHNIFAVAVCQLTRLRSQIGSVTNIWRHVAEIFRRFNASGDCQTVLDRTLTTGQLAAGRHVEDHFTQRATRLAFVGLQLVKAVQRFLCRLNGLAHFPVVITPFDVKLSQKADGFH